MDINLDLSNLKDLPLPLQIASIIGACALIFFLGYFFDISSLQKKLDTDKKNEADLKMQIQSLHNNHAAMYAEIAKGPLVEKMLQDWQGKLIKSSDLPDLLNEILKTGTGNQLQFKLFNPAPAVKEGPYLKVPIKTEIIGNYHQIASFFSEIANMASIVVISDFTLVKNTDMGTTSDTALNSQTSNESILHALLSLEVYYLPEKS